MASSYPSMVSGSHDGPLTAQKPYFSSFEDRGVARASSGSATAQSQCGPGPQPESWSTLKASHLPDGFPPKLAYRALAAYSLLRTLSCQLRLSPFTPNVFLRALLFPFPNRLLGQIHVCLLRILLPNLDLGYAYRTFGQNTSKRIRTEEHDGVRQVTVPLVAGDNLTYLDGLSWPLFFQDYVRLTEDALNSAMNETVLNVDFRNIALRAAISVDGVEDSEEVEDTEQPQKAFDHKKKPHPALTAAEKDVPTVVDKSPKGKSLSMRGRGTRGRGLPTRQNRVSYSEKSPKQTRSPRFKNVDSSGSEIDSDTDNDESDYDDQEDSGYRLKGQRGKRKRKRKSKNNRKQKAKKDSDTKGMPSTPGSRVLEVSTAELPVFKPGIKLNGEDERDAASLSVNAGPTTWPTSVFPKDTPGSSSAFQSFGSADSSRQPVQQPLASLTHFGGPVGANFIQGGNASAFPTNGGLTSFATPSTITNRKVTEPRLSHGFGVPNPLSIGMSLSGYQLHMMHGKQAFVGSASAQFTTSHPAPSLQSVRTERLRKTNSHEVSKSVADELQNFGMHTPNPSGSTPISRPTPASNLSDEVLSERRESGELTIPAKDGPSTGVSAAPPNTLAVQISRSSSTPHKAIDGDVDVADNQNVQEKGNKRLEDTPKEINTYEQSTEDWPHVKPLETMRRGCPYHRLAVEEKLHILEFLLDELLAVGSVANEFTRRHCVTACYDFPYGTLPSASELNALENDDECRVCGMEGELLCCDGCTASYHRRCIDEAIGSNIPEGAWLCTECKVLDPARFGPLRGDKKSALDWFTLGDVVEASYRRPPPSDGNPSHVVKSSKSTHDSLTGERRADNEAFLNSGSTCAPSLQPKPNTEVEGSSATITAESELAFEGRPIMEVRHNATLSEKSTKGHNDGHTPATLAAHTPITGDLDNSEYIVVHGFVFRRKKENDQTESECELEDERSERRNGATTYIAKKSIPPLTAMELSTFLGVVGSQQLSLSWPLVQIPTRACAASHIPQKVTCDQYFALPQSFDPSWYTSRYRLAPYPRSKQKCVGSQMHHLVQSQYEDECALNNTRQISSMLSSDMTSDSGLTRRLRASSDLYNPYHLFTSYLLKLEARLKAAFLIHEMWGTRNSRGKTDVWWANVAKCRSVKRLALLLVRVVDAANSRVFLKEWFKNPNQSSGKSEEEPDNRIYMPLPSDWTPDLELHKRKLERSSYPDLRRLLVVEAASSADVWGRLKGNIERSTVSGSRKRKHSKPQVWPSLQNPSDPKGQPVQCLSPNQLRRGSEDGKMKPGVLSKEASVEKMNVVYPTRPSAVSAFTQTSGYSISDNLPNASNADLSSSSLPPSHVSENGVSDSNLGRPHVSCDQRTIPVPPEGGNGTGARDVSYRFQRQDDDSDGRDLPDKAETVIRNHVEDNPASGQKMGEEHNLDGEDGRPKRSRRSGRLRNRGDSHGRTSLVKGSHSTPSKEGEFAGDGRIQSLIAVERSSKIRMLEDLMRIPFEKELHWPLAGRALFEPVGCLPPREMKRLARNAGMVTAPYLTYSAAFEVGQGAFCHIWRKKTLQCDSFEKLVMQIRILDSFINKTAIGACESLARRGSAYKTQAQKVIRCSHRDLETGTTHYFVVNKGKLRGCWIPEESIDFSPLILERSRRRRLQITRCKERVAAKSNGEPTQGRKVSKPTTKKAITAIPNVTPSGPDAAKNVPTRSQQFVGSSVGVGLEPVAKAGGTMSEFWGLIEKRLLQHRLDTENVLLKCTNLGLSSVPPVEMQALRDKCMQQLQRAIASVKDNRIPLMDTSQISKLIVHAEEAASRRFKKSVEKLRSDERRHQSAGTFHIGSALLSTMGVNGGYSVDSGAERSAGIPVATGQHLPEYNTTDPKGALAQPWQVHLNSQVGTHASQAPFAAATPLNSFPFQDQFSFSGKDAQTLQAMQFQLPQDYTSGHGASRKFLQGQFQGAVNTNAGGQLQGSPPIGVGAMSNVHSSIAGALPSHAQYDRFSNGSSGFAANFDPTALSPSEVNWGSTSANPSAGMGIQFQTNVPANNIYQVAGQQQLIAGNNIRDNSVAPVHNPALHRSSPRSDALSAMDFEPRSLEEMANDSYR